ncbi:MAG: malate synthase A [Bacteroidia bacterium]|nr:malate synthase A [Bacteroidia bacterium]
MSQSVVPVSLPDGMVLRGPVVPGSDTILTPDALAFVAALHRKFDTGRRSRLLARRQRQALLDAGQLPDFLPQTRHIREAEWQVAPLPPDLLDRRVEITGPPERKMIINALNSGARVFMADFEDAHAPTWANCIAGQVNLCDAVRRTITYHDPVRQKDYVLGPQPAVLFVRPRGWHLVEKHLLVDGQPVSGALFDVGLYLFHNAHELMARGTGPYFYLPKLEGHLEARLWNEVFVFAQAYLRIPVGTIKATVLIETILASFELDEILYELRAHSAGLNCGRWDYIFSYIKKLAAHPQFLLPDRSQVTMTVPFMEAYALLVIKTCHRRGVHAMGGMAAQIPVRDDPAAHAVAMARVAADKEREARNGHDGTWVAHPGLVPVAQAQFDAWMPGPNQISRQREDVQVTGADLLRPVAGTITETGVRLNIDVALQYIEAWLGGNGCVPIYHLMEDAATAEISRSQLWQWAHHPDARLEDGRPVTLEMICDWVPVQLAYIRTQVGEERYLRGQYEAAAALLLELIRPETFCEFLTLPAYDRLD